METAEDLAKQGRAAAGDYTRALRGKVSLSSIDGKHEFIWGSADLAAYLVAAPFFFGMCFLLPHVFPILASAVHPIGALVITLLVMSVVTIGAGVWSEYKGLQVRELRRNFSLWLGRHPLGGQGVISAFGPVGREPRWTLELSALVVPPPVGREVEKESDGR